MTSFEKHTKLIVKDMLNKWISHIDGSVYTPLVFIKPQLIPMYRVLETFTYKHKEQDINHGVYTFTKDDIIEMNDAQFMPDRSKIRFLGYSYNQGMNWYHPSNPNK